MKLFLKKLFIVSLIIIGILFILNSILMSITANFNFGVIAALIFGLSILFYGLFFDRIKTYTRFGFFKFLKYFVVSSFVLIIIIIVFIVSYGISDTSDYGEDAAIVLGAGIKGDLITYPLACRLNKAVEYNKRNPSAIIVLSGGKGFQEDITEALAMERYLLNQGISKSRILLEQKSTSTYENLVFSKKILDEYFKKPYRVVIITSDFTIYRATELAKISRLNCTSIHSKIQWYEIIPMYLREFFAIIKLWVFKR